jgi:hypothetical protein
MNEFGAHREGRREKALGHEHGQHLPEEQKERDRGQLKETMMALRGWHQNYLL